MNKEQDETAFAVLGETSPEYLYEPDVFMWLPHLLFGRGFKKVACPECGTKDIGIKGYNDEPFARKSKFLLKEKKNELFYIFLFYFFVGVSI